MNRLILSPKNNAGAITRLGSAYVKDTANTGESSQNERYFMDCPGIAGSHNGIVGFREVFQTEKLREQARWAREETTGCLRFAGTGELLGAAGMILPLPTGILPWPVPLAGMGLALIQPLSILTVHIPHREYKALPLNVVLLMLSLFVVAGRWDLIISSFHNL